MKRFLFISIICVICGGIFHTANARVKSQKVILYGSLAKPGLMRSTQQPVEAYQNSANIQLDFLLDLGDLVIEVVDQNSVVVYQNTIDATEGGTLFIDTQEWEAGKYTLLIADEEGGTLEGVFNIE